LFTLTDQRIPVIDIAAYGFVDDYSLYLHRRELIETGVGEISVLESRGDTDLRNIP
jgi:hypothetical protein